MIFYKILLLGIFLNVGYLQPMDNVHLSTTKKIKEGLKGVSEAEPWFPLVCKIEKNRIFKIKNIYTDIN